MGRRDVLVHRVLIQVDDDVALAYVWDFSFPLGEAPETSLSCSPVHYFEKPFLRACLDACPVQSIDQEGSMQLFATD
jgi:hypothetical protein